MNHRDELSCMFRLRRTACSVYAFCSVTCCSSFFPFCGDGGVIHRLFILYYSYLLLRRHAPTLCGPTGRIVVTNEPDRRHRRSITPWWKWGENSGG